MSYQEDYYPRRASAAPQWIAAFATLIGIVAFVVWLAPDILHAPGPSAAVGGQAPPAARRVLADPAPARAAQPAAPVPVDAAAADAESLRQYQAAVDAANASSGPAPDAVQTQNLAPMPALPLSSAGEPVIDRAQQAQIDQSAQLAADEQQAAIRAAQLADATGRAPDVSYADAVALLHRDPCHVPRADPATCARGLFKPTPVR